MLSLSDVSCLVGLGCGGGGGLSCGLSAEDLRGMSELGGLEGLEGRSAGAGSCALCREEAECPPRSNHSLEVSSGVPPPPPLLSPTPSVLFLHNKEGGETGSE